MQLQQPKILELLREEIDAVTPYDTMIPSLDKAKLPYLNMVIKETLRYSSPGFGTFRTCAVDREVAGVTFPAKTTLAVWNPPGKSLPLIAGNSRFNLATKWTYLVRLQCIETRDYGTSLMYLILNDGGLDSRKPADLIFLSHMVQGIASVCPIPLNLCIDIDSNCASRDLGQGLAMLEMTLTLATVFRRYDLSLEPGFKMEYLSSFTLKPKTGLPIRVARRKF